MDNVRTIEWTDGCNFGQGYDYRRDAVVGACVTGLPDASKIAGVGSGYETNYQMVLIEDSHDLTTKLGISASVAASHEGISGSAKGSFASENHSDGHSVYCLLRISVTAPVRSLSAAQEEQINLTDGALKLLEDKPQSFTERFGTGFISGAKEGGEMFILFRIKTTSEDDKQKIRADVSGSAGTEKEGGKLSAALKRTFESIATSRNVDFTVYKKGGKPETTFKDFTIDEIINKALAFGEEVKTSPAKYGAIIMPYAELAKLTGVDFSMHDKIFEQVESAARLLLEVSDRLAVLKYVRDNAEQFTGGIDKASIEGNIESVQSIYEKVRREFHLAQDASVLTDVAPELTVPETPGEISNRLGITEMLKNVAKSTPQRWKSLPRTAQDIAEMLKTTKDGEYTIFIDCEGVLKPTKLYCTFSEEPRSYITLHSNGGDKNTSYWPVSANDGNRWRKGKGIKNRYRKIGFDPVTKEVDISDSAFAEFVDGLEGPLHDRDHRDTEVAVYKYATYATASASNHPNRTPYGTANVDLTGTDWEIDENVKWVNSGFDAKGRGEYELSAGGNRRQASMEIGGAPGVCRPSPSLKLKFIGT